MPSWEETKRAGQTAFIDMENDVPDSIAALYQQIQSTGHVHPLMESDIMTRQIEMDNFRQPEQEQEILPELAKGIEPER